MYPGVNSNTRYAVQHKKVPLGANTLRQRTALSPCCLLPGWPYYYCTLIAAFATIVPAASFVTSKLTTFSFSPPHKQHASTGNDHTVRRTLNVFAKNNLKILCSLCVRYFNFRATFSRGFFSMHLHCVRSLLNRTEFLESKPDLLIWVAITSIKSGGFK